MEPSLTLADLGARPHRRTFETTHSFAGDDIRLNGRMTTKPVAVHRLTLSVAWYDSRVNVAPIIRVVFVGGSVLKSGAVSGARTEDFTKLSEVPQPLRAALVDDFNAASPDDAPVLDPATGEVA